jgi:hypothetical protein
MSFEWGVGQLERTYEELENWPLKKGLEELHLGSTEGKKVLRKGNILEWDVEMEIWFIQVKKPEGC